MNQDIIKEFEVIRKRGKGILYPEAVVEFAKNKKTMLHSRFEWDDSKAAEAHRLWQARQLIKVCYQQIEAVETPMYVSLKAERYENGGYRSIVDVLSNEDLYHQTLQNALEDFQYWKQRYKTLQELTPVFESMVQVEQTIKKKK